MSDNPYAPPGASLETQGAPLTFSDEPRTVGVGRGFGWMADGYLLAFKSIGVWIAIMLLLFVITIVTSLIPIIGTIANSLLQPLFTAGLMLGCRDLDRGQSLRVEHIGAAFGFERAVPLMIMAAVTTAGS